MELRNGQIDLISFKTTIDTVLPDSKYARRNASVNFYATKERVEQNKWGYRIHLDTNTIFMNGMDQKEHPYVFIQLESWTKELIIAEDYSEKLANEIERAIEMNWEEMADKTPVDDMRFDIWV